MVYTRCVWIDLAPMRWLFELKSVLFLRTRHCDESIGSVWNSNISQNKHYNDKKKVISQLNSSREREKKEQLKENNTSNHLSIVNWNISIRHRLNIRINIYVHRGICFRSGSTWNVGDCARFGSWNGWWSWICYRFIDWRPDVQIPWRQTKLSDFRSRRTLHLFCTYFTSSSQKLHTSHKTHRPWAMWYWK